MDQNTTFSLQNLSVFSFAPSKKLVIRQSSVYSFQWKFLTNYSNWAFPSVNCWLIGLNPAEARREEMLLVGFKLPLISPPLWIRSCMSSKNICAVTFSPRLWNHLGKHQLKATRQCVLPFAVRRVSVGVRGLPRVPEEAAAFPWAADAVETAPRPRWAGVPAVLHGGADEHRVAFREDAFSVAITPAGEQQPGKEKGGMWEWALAATAYGVEGYPGKGGALLPHRICSTNIMLETGAAEFSQLYESTGIKVILHVQIKGEGWRAFQSSELSPI